MNAEALIGMVLGTCTLQKVLGQGGMGAVFLAQQSRPRRQVAVKVLLPASSSTAQQRAAFLERFRRETDAAASLEHPHILPVYEYAEQNGLAYLVVPYVSGGTLRDIIERDKQLPLLQVLNYLDQLASALDFAHARSVVHRDVKPANILMTSEGRLLLTDFGLVKIMADAYDRRSPLTVAGAPIGTPDYMAPEQVIGNTVDGRADQYALGIITYQMVTGRTPFQGETPMQIAAQQLQTPPPSPRLLRPGLPVTVEQVMLRALAKRPAERYAYVQEFAAAFRTALVSSGELLNDATGNLSAMKTSSSARLFTPRGLFDPSWQTGSHSSLPSATAGSADSKLRPPVILSAAQVDAPRPAGSGLLSRTGMFAKVQASGQTQTVASTLNHMPPSTPRLVLPTSTEAHPAFPPKQFGQFGQKAAPTDSMSPVTAAQPTLPPVGLGQMSPLQNTTGTMQMLGSGQSPNNRMKLSGPVQVVQVPIAGQPGRYVTGLLPMSATTTQEHETPSRPLTKSKPKKPWKTVAITFLIILALVGSTSFLLRWHGVQSTPKAKNMLSHNAGAPNVQATATAQVIASAEANQILSDPLSQNIHNWPVSANEFFADNAYHVLNNGSSGGLAVILAEKPFTVPNAFTLTMWEVKGDDTSANNSFGMILRFNQVTHGKKAVTTFYSFEVTNSKSGGYRFYKYDDSHGTADKFWSQLWQHPFGSEFHRGQGMQNANTIRVYQNGKTFTFTVNGKLVGTLSDSSFSSGTIGMLVNLKGTEVAFQNMLITPKVTVRQPLPVSATFARRR